LPDKDDNLLGTNFPKGVNLSGGQWQKLSIARSFYRQAPVLILDEPTSAVDSQTEQEIFTSIFANNTRQTQIIISHKFANIRQADQIIVLDHGRIVETGNHHHLLARRGLYASLYKQQSAAFTD
jgi:ABC-type multidrug transport system fused ATPase/permease subunit